jgi:molybdopterin synthase sulfur carrier subunit
MKLLYFAWIRERIGRGEEEVALPQEVETVGDLISWLKGRGEEFKFALEQDALVRVAVDRRHVPDRSVRIAGAREVALFPPMTGG